MELSGVLKEFGLDDQEQQVYLHVLKHGPVNQQAIADQLQILRQTVYEIVKRMVRKGYLSSTLLKKRKYYSAVEPRFLLARLRERADRLEESLPAFETLRQERSSLMSETFIGKEGLKNLFALSLESKEEVLWMANKTISDRMFKRFYWHNYAAKRLERRLPIKLVIEPTRTRDWDTDPKLLRETRRHELLRGIPSGLVLFEDKAFIYTAEQDRLHGVFIQDASTKQLLERLFMRLWREAK